VLNTYLKIRDATTVACWSEMDSELSVAVTDVMNGKKTAQEAMDKLAERFDELLAE
jgi:multiple sugar transport system substrate-binding protein